MTALADYLDLKFAVADQVGNRALSDVMPRLVQMAESKLNSTLRTRQQITPATLTFTDGASTLPTDFLEILHVFGLCGKQLHASTLADSRREGSQYARYSIDGTNIYLKGFSGNRDIEYYAALPTLSASPTTSNWLLSKYPDVYLYAVSKEAAKYLRDADGATAMDTLLKEAMTALETNDERARWANSTVRVQAQTP